MPVDAAAARAAIAAELVKARADLRGRAPAPIAVSRAAEDVVVVMEPVCEPDASEIDSAILPTDRAQLALF